MSRRIRVEVAGATDRQQVALEEIRAATRAALLALLGRLDGMVVTVADGTTTTRAYLSDPEVQRAAADEFEGQLVGAMLGALLVGREMGQATPLERELLEAAQGYGDAAERHEDLMSDASGDLWYEAGERLGEKAREYAGLVRDRRGGAAPVGNVVELCPRWGRK